MKRNLLGIVLIGLIAMASMGQQECCPATESLYTFSINGDYLVTHIIDANNVPGIRDILQLNTRASWETGESNVVSGTIELLSVQIGSGTPITPSVPVQATMSGQIIPNSDAADFNPFTLNNVPVVIFGQQQEISLTIDMTGNPAQTVTDCQKNAQIMGGTETATSAQIGNLNGSWTAETDSGGGA